MPVGTDERHVVLEQRFKIEFGVDPEFLEKLGRVRSLLSSKYHGKLELGRLFEILLDEYIDRHSPEGRQRRRAERDKKTRLKRDPGNGGTEENGGNRNSGKDERAGQNGGDGEDGGNAGHGENRGRKENVTSAGNKNPPRSKAASSQKDPRYIPRSVRDKVWARDGGRCAFVSPGGRRCGSRWDLEIDHIVPLARGGGSSPSNLRLLCSRHNLLEAERAYGQEHMARFRGT